jgi:2-polyprenyl-6-methoxyphenol hydroxylase-like FAD-dependent oxidoreductase
MGLLEPLREVAYAFDEVALIDESGRRRGRIRPEQFADGVLLNLMRPDLESVLRESLPSGVQLRFGTSLMSVASRDGGVRVTLEDGGEIDADLLVGADGIHSTVRGLVFGEESRFFRYLGLHTAAFTFEAPDLHELIQGRAYLTDTVDRQMGFYALRDGRVATFAVHRAPDPALPDDLRQAVQDSYRGLGWVTPRALEQCPPSEEIYYDQVAQVQLPAWSQGRVVLLGDACYAVSLIAGQGASLGIAGAYVLAEQLARAGSLEQSLARYETLWRPVVEDTQHTGRSAARWFLPSSPRQLRTRRAMLRLARLPLLDRLVSSALTGKPTPLINTLRRAGDTPRLADVDTNADTDAGIRS